MAKATRRRRLLSGRSATLCYDVMSAAMFGIFMPYAALCLCTPSAQLLASFAELRDQRLWPGLEDVFVPDHTDDLQVTFRT